MAIVGLGELNEKLSWYAARASGLIAWALVTLSILWGLALSTRLIRRRGVPAWLLDLHKFLATLSVVFVAVHIAALWADNFVYFGPRELFVPFASRWRTSAVAWGIAATYLLVAIQVTSWVMKRLRRGLWHAVHLTSIPMFGLATLHGFTAGADNRNLAVQWIALTGGLFVFLLAAFRMLAPRRSSRRATSPPRVVTHERAPELSERALRSRSADRDTKVEQLARMVESAEGSRPGRSGGGPFRSSARSSF
jgi:predicted ferric reductase